LATAVPKRRFSAPPQFETPLREPDRTPPEAPPERRPGRSLATSRIVLRERPSPSNEGPGIGPPPPRRASEEQPRRPPAALNEAGGGRFKEPAKASPKAAERDRRGRLEDQTDRRAREARGPQCNRWDGRTRAAKGAGKRETKNGGRGVVRKFTGPTDHRPRS